MKPEEARKRVEQLFPVYGKATDQIGRMVFNVLCEAYLQGRLDQAGDELAYDLRNAQR